jgi:hypothetical protein
MQTNFQDRQSALITEAVQTIQEQVKLKGSPSQHDYNQLVIPIVCTKIYDTVGYLIAEVGAELCVCGEGILSSTEYQEAKDLMQLADYCLNYNPQS